MSRYSLIVKALSAIYRNSSDLQPSFETEISSNTAAAACKQICTPEPIETFAQDNYRDLILGAELMRKRRVARAAHFPKEIFGEVAWDIMIILYVERSNKPLSLTAILMSIHVPMSTLLRWITYLEVQLLVKTVSVVGDERVRLLQMTDMGRNLMDECMTELLQI